jgi:hypothetical protein
MRFEESGDFGLGFFFFRLGYVVVSRTAFCCIDFFDGLAVFGLRWAIARGFPVLQKYSLPCAISPIHAQPTCIYICRNPRVARNTYIQNSYSQGIPVQYTSRVPPHTHILRYTFWKRPDARFPTLARTRPIGREQLRDPLLQRRAVKGSEVAAFPQFCLRRLHGRAPIFLRATHSTTKSSDCICSSFRVWLPTARVRMC